jgi:PmbA protein
MSERRWLEACQEGCGLAKAAGATEAEVCAQHSEEVSVAIEKHDVQVARSCRESSFGVRVLVGDRTGFASTNAVHDLPAACRDAVALAKVSPEDPHHHLPEPVEVRAVAGLFDCESSRIGVGDVVRIAGHMLDVAESIDRRVILGDGGVSSVRTTRAIATTRGAAAEETTTLFSHHVIATAREHSCVSSMDFQFGAARRVLDIDVAPAVTLACRNALDSLGGTRGEAFRGLAILSPSAVLDILIAPFLFQTDGRNALRGLSRWRDAVGRPVASHAVSIIDDGTMPGGIASSSFDREGVPHAPLALVDRGRLASLFQNAYSSAALGSANTGHAAGLASSPPMIGPTNLAWVPGSATLEELVSDTRQGLVVERFSGNVDPISGDFSGVAKAAHLVRDGQRACAVAGSLVAGNAFDALRAVVDVASDRRQIFGFAVPYVRVDGVSVTPE